MEMITGLANGGAPDPTAATSFASLDAFSISMPFSFETRASALDDIRLLRPQRGLAPAVEAVGRPRVVLLRSTRKHGGCLETCTLGRRAAGGGRGRRAHAGHGQQAERGADRG